ncbi:ImmA/IrrE family metallo-endopeptidase [Gemella sp. GH3]|uniref:ImmA/IrrE family metallo-endopeptidase n=1 Tax=unclassified Gemella TaxID=2624949 RepID=UPI0015D07EF7|nr:MULTISPECIES: ImmA/IrrE family metallo-endopeptidase [unclassified Gemella]MBF0714523.1 ImmA/IrrE family metallo-endopeptidase [Gemella sp. GH3.1]NYS51475.1 ImmA/IrrE family metallo-endopeptidase [Gemella sp. GH3]
MSKKIKISGLEYEVIEQEYFKTPDDERNLWGYCDYEQQKIYIRSSLSTEKKKQVLIHELTHAIFHGAGYTEQDEDTVHRISLVMHQVIKENISTFNEMFSYD